MYTFTLDVVRISTKSGQITVEVFLELNEGPFYQNKLLAWFPAKAGCTRDIKHQYKSITQLITLINLGSHSSISEAMATCQL